MIDTGASSSYVCSDLVTILSLKPVRQEQKCIEQMYGTVTKSVEIYQLNVQSMAVDDFNLNVECRNAEKGVLTYSPNSHVKELKEKFRLLRKLRLSDAGSSVQQLPVHIILGAADYQRIQSTEQPVLGENPDKDPGAEFTMLGWVLYGRMIANASSAEKDLFLNSSQDEFERLCSLDVLGLVEQPDLNSEFHENFTSHQTGEVTGEVIHYIPHQPVIREDAESTKLRIVYDCSAKQNPQQPSLNGCLETGPAL